MAAFLRFLPSMDINSGFIPIAFIDGQLLIDAVSVGSDSDADLNTYGTVAATQFKTTAVQAANYTAGFFSGIALPVTTTDRVTGIYAIAIAKHASGTQEDVYGAEYQSYQGSNNPVTNLVGMSTYIDTNTFGDGSNGTVANGISLQVFASSCDGSNPITNLWGLYVGDQAGGATINRAIQTNQSTGYAYYGAGVAPSYFGGAVALIDGQTAPGTVAGQAQIYVDIADGDLKVKFGDGTTKVLAADT